MRETPRLFAALTLVGIIALLAAGCGTTASSATRRSSNAGDGTSSGRASRTDSASASGGRGPQASRREKAVRFAECVRAHGVPHFPDPDPTGSFNFGVDVSAATFTAAVNACKTLQPPGTLSSVRSPTQQSAALKFAHCVRAHGVPDFPDPVSGQPLIDTDHIPSSNSPGGMSILNAATRQCASLLGPDTAATGGGSGG